MTAPLHRPYPPGCYRGTCEYLATGDRTDHTWMLLHVHARCAA